MKEFTIFSENNFDFVNDLLESNMYKLMGCADFANLEKSFFEAYFSFEQTLSKEQQATLENILSYLFELENYKNVFCYFYGIKIGEDISKL